MDFLRRLVREEEGQGLIEYVLIVGLIALVAVAVIILAGDSIKGIWENITEQLDEVPGASSATEGD